MTIETTTRIMSIDPGMETGVVIAEVATDARLRILRRAQITGGLSGAAARILDVAEVWEVERVVMESFSPRPGARSWRLEELEPLRFEGWALGMFGTVEFRRPEARKLINASMAQTDEYLRWADLWTLPSQIDRPDAKDVNSAMAHLVGYLRDQAHMPTIKSLIAYGDQMVQEEG